VCVYEGLVMKAPKEGWLHRTLYKKKEERFSSPKGDRLIEKIAKKQEIFIRRDRRALLTEKKNNFCLLSNSSFLIFSVTNL
jgi:hypothetical protein